MPHEDFTRYATLAPDIDKGTDVRTLCEDICRACLLPDDYQVGKSVVVLKKGQTELLDTHLAACQEDAATKVQSVARKWLVDMKEVQIFQPRESSYKTDSQPTPEPYSQAPLKKIKLDAVLKLQTAIRAYRARQTSDVLRDERAAAQEEIRKIQEEQTAMEREVAEEDAAGLLQRQRPRILNLPTLTLTLMGRQFRGFKGRESAAAKLRAVTLIQAAWRRSDTSARVSYLRKKYLALVVSVQRHIRGHLARKHTKDAAIANQVILTLTPTFHFSLPQTYFEVETS